MSAVTTGDGEVGGSIGHDCFGDDVGEGVGLHLCWRGVDVNRYLVSVSVSVLVSFWWLSYGSVVGIYLSMVVV